MSSSTPKTRRRRLLAGTSAAAIAGVAAASLVVMPADAAIYKFKLTSSSQYKVVAYENHGCTGDSDTVYPGEYENGANLGWTRSIKIGSGIGFTLNGIDKKPKDSGVKCVDVWGVYSVALGFTY